MAEASLLQRVERNPDIMLGKPVIKGTRITVEHILDLLSKGQTAEDIVREYGELKHEDVRAALAYASLALGSDETHWARAHA